MKWVAILLCVFVVAGCASVPRKVWTAPVTYNFHLQDQGAFVRYPTILGDVVGAPMSVVTLPLMPFLEPETGEGAGWGMFLLGPTLVGDLTGTPFLAIRRAFWDFPRWCIERRRSSWLERGEALPAFRAESAR